MRLLLHICCGPCAVFPLKHLRDSGYEITGYFYNPNIHPYKEFTRRLETAKEFALKMNLEMIVDDSYTLEEFLSQALSASGAGGRCGMCYESRLRQTARIAKANNFDCFSTSLLVSPYQKHELIKEVCDKISKEEDIPFLYVDFRTGWNEGVTISKELELYRQPYCGCIFSEKDRYHKVRKESK